MGKVNIEVCVSSDCLTCETKKFFGGFHHRLSGSDWPSGPLGTDRCAHTQNRDFVPLLSINCAPADRTTYTLPWFFKLLNLRES